MPERDIDRLLALPETGTYPGLAVMELAAASLPTGGLSLPAAHATLLRRTNGVEAYGGYYRLFGFGARSNVDQLRWNGWAFWKFAWLDRVTDYWCFGETAWGDQYAYLAAELQPGATPRIFCLDALSMKPRLVADSFAAFLREDFLRAARDPADPLVAPARARFGKLPPDIHLIYQPPLLLGGAARLENMMRMTSRGAMICNGDIAIGLDQGADDGDRVKRVVSGIDASEDGRAG